MIDIAVQLFQNNELKAEGVTDYDGRYLINSLAAGSYEMFVLYLSYDSLINVNIASKQRTIQNVTLQKLILTGEIRARNNEKSSKRVFNREESNQLPGR